MYSVVTNLVTSLEFQPIRCSTTLFHFGWTRNVYVATRIIFLSITAESSATSGYVVAPERSGQIEAWINRNVERARKKLNLFQAVVLIDAACNHESFETINLNFPYFKLISNCIIVFVPCMEISFIFCLCHYLLCRRGNNHFDVLFRRIRHVIFPSKDGKDAVREGRPWRKDVYFPPDSASFTL